MKKAMKRTACVLLLLMALAALVPGQVAAIGNDQSYSYNYDLDGNALPAPDPYEVRYRVDVSQYVAGGLKGASSLFVQDNMLYICDTGNNRIIQMELGPSGPRYVRQITGTDAWSLSGPKDIFVTSGGELYIADTGNQRILWLDRSLNIVKIVERPEHALFQPFPEFIPEKLVVTGGGRIYVQAKGVNRGLIELDEMGEFVGFMGASSVVFAWEDYIWKLISTDAQKAQMESFVPTEYNNLSLDRSGMIYTTTSVFNTADLQAGTADPIRRLNLKGKDILIRNNGSVIGDTAWGADGPSRFCDVTVLENDLFFALDTTKNRIFAYDKQGTNLYAFGGYGTKVGYFINPTSLEHWNKDLLVLDAASGLVTVLKPTRYGERIMSAIEAYDLGNYDASLACWQEVLAQNGNNMMAYDGIGKILLRKGDYRQALDYLKYADDDYYYSNAWKRFRKDWIEQYLIWVVLAIVLLVVIRWGVKVINRERSALDAYEERKTAAGEKYVE